MNVKEKYCIYFLQINWELINYGRLENLGPFTKTLFWRADGVLLKF